METSVFDPAAGPDPAAVAIAAVLALTLGIAALAVVLGLLRRGRRTALAGGAILIAAAIGAATNFAYYHFAYVRSSGLVQADAARPETPAIVVATANYGDLTLARMMLSGRVAQAYVLDHTDRASFREDILGQTHAGPVAAARLTVRTDIACRAILDPVGPYTIARDGETRALAVHDCIGREPADVDPTGAGHLLLAAAPFSAAAPSDSLAFEAWRGTGAGYELMLYYAQPRLPPPGATRLVNPGYLYARRTLARQWRAYRGSRHEEVLFGTEW